MGKPNRIWAISAIHGNIDRLVNMHDEIFKDIKTGDRILYMGNYTGYGPQARQCIDEILAFRRTILAKPSMIPSDLLYLRGRQEEMWDKLLQLPFAPNPQNVLLWMLGNGLSETLRSYGLCPHDGIEACQKGVMGITKWTNQIRKAIRSNAGHEKFMTNYVRAALTDQEATYPMLFVHAGLDSNKPLEAQGDNFWWLSDSFETMQSAYKPFEKVIRGYDPKHRGVYLNCISATIDGGCGFGGELVCAGFTPDGSVEELLQA